jgi:hypothetical protein
MFLTQNLRMTPLLKVMKRNRKMKEELKVKMQKLS